MKRHLLTTAAFAALLPLSAQAQQALQAQLTPAPGVAAVQTPASATASEAAAPNLGTPEDVIVTGTRQQGRTKAESPAPVDVISAAELQRTGEQNVFDALNKVLPSIDLPPFGFDTAGLVRAIRLRGLSPDDTLVLVDGKRRHVSGNINADIGPVGGSDPVDLDTIPISLIDHVEVLRDGAAAIYGSDAIAGVINIILKHATHGGTAYAQEGATYVQDGFTNNIGASFANPIGDKGYFDVAGDYRYHDHTNRDGDYPQNLGPIKAPVNVSQIEGDPRNNVVSLGYNAAYEFVPELEAYSFATYTYKHSESFENFRDPNVAGAYQTEAITPATPFGNLTAAKYYPVGFTPLEALNEDDYSVTGGARGTVVGDLHYDLSSTYGGDIDNISTLQSINPDLLHATGNSPLHFHAGEFNDTEWTNNLDLSKPFDVGIFAKPINVAFGAEYRRDTYQINPGDPASRFLGGSQAYPGFTVASAGSFHRSNEAVYGDIDTHPLPQWEIDFAGRFEHYSDVGDTETGRVTTRYDFTPDYAIRGTISNGFRAPTLAQEGFSAVNVAPTSAGGQLPVASPGARLLGAIPLKAERSQNYSVGFLASPIERLHIALDFYEIDIRDQIVDSGQIVQTPNGPNILTAFNLNGFGIPPGVPAANVFAQFYTNGVSTHNRGADLTIDYNTPLPSGKINWLLAANFNSTEITRTEAAAQLTPDVLSEIKESTPKSKIIAQAVYLNNPFSVTLRETRFGQVAEILADGNSGAAPYTFNRNKPHFITDLELGYKITPDVSFFLGADNLFDTYANHTTAGARFHNAEQYIISSPYGIDGGFYYGRISYSFGNAAPPLPEPPPPAIAPPPTAAAPTRTYLVFFDWDRADLTQRARQIVLAAAQASTQVQTTQLQVNGYTDLSGTEAYNKRLSIRRAETVKSELVKDGVAAGEIFIHGFGEADPLVPTAPGVREPQNRRVEIVLK